MKCVVKAFTNRTFSPVSGWVRTTGCSASGILRLQREALLDRHGGPEGSLDAVPGAQAGDLRLDALGQALVGQRHVDPDHVAAHLGRLGTPKHGPELRALAPRRVAVIGVLVLLRARVRTLVDQDQAGIFRIAAHHRVVLERAEAPREGDVLGPGEVLVAQEQHLVLEQERFDLREQGVVARRVAEIDVDELGSDGAGQRLDLDRRVQPTTTSDGGGRGARGRQ